MSSTNKTLSDWLAHITSLHEANIDLGLSRILPLAEKLKLRHFSCPVVLVAGTNGKGSIIASLEAFSLAAGYRVSAYTSPHLLRFNERLRTQGINTVDFLWEKAFSVVEKARKTTTLSFFEFTTLAALWICREQQPDIMLLEVGLGGRLDAVNVVEPDISVVSNIALDHMDYLGHSREAIAVEKAGIFRRGKPVVCGDPEPPSTLLQQAQQLQAPLYCYQRDYTVDCTADGWSWRGVKQQYTHLPRAALKSQNIASALMVIELLGWAIAPTVMSAVLANVSLPGRYEYYQQKPLIIMDVAHNPQSCAYLAACFAKEQVNGKRHAVVGMLADKNIADSLAALSPLIDVWWVASLDEPRGATADVLVEQLAQDAVCYRFDSVAEALIAVQQQLSVNDSMLIFGSFHTVAAAKQCLSGACDATT